MNLEVISLFRFLPAAGAELGDVTREELREADMGQWSHPCGRHDDLQAGLAPPGPDDPTEEQEASPTELRGYDIVLPLEDDGSSMHEPLIELRFSEG